MNIKDDFLNPTDLQILYKESLKGKIDKAGLSGTQKAQLLDFAFDEQTKALDYMNEMLMANQDLTFDDCIKNNSDYKQANMIIDWLKTEQATPELISQPIKGKQKNKTSYIWQTDPSKELPVLYKLMINEYKLIAPETTYEQFEAVFTGQPIESINPIRWHQDNASELLYFNEAIKGKVDDVWNIYQRMAACFIKPDGKQFNATWKSLKTNIEINLSSDKQKAIDELVKNF